MTTAGIHALDLTRQPDTWLVAACLRDGAQSDKAFRELVRRYTGLVYSAAYRMSNRQDLSEEITQDVFVKVHQNLARFDRNRAFKPWLMQIAANTTISALRKKQHQHQQQTVSIDALEEQGWQLPEADTGESPSEAVLEQRLNQETLTGLLGQLDDKYRQVLTLRYLSDMSYEEVAESLGIPLNTTRTWIRRGLDQLRQLAAKSRQPALSD